MSAGFYKSENGELLFSPTTVESATYMLRAEQHEDYEYPQDGWYWFDNAVQAAAALLPPETAK